MTGRRRLVKWKRPKKNRERKWENSRVSTYQLQFLFTICFVVESHKKKNINVSSQIITIMWKKRKKFLLVVAAGPPQPVRASRWCVCRLSTCQKLFHQQRLKWTKIRCYFWIIDLPSEEHFRGKHEWSATFLEIAWNRWKFSGNSCAIDSRLVLTYQERFFDFRIHCWILFRENCWSEDFFNFLASCRLGWKIVQKPWKLHCEVLMLAECQWPEFEMDFCGNWGMAARLVN